MKLEEFLGELKKISDIIDHGLDESLGARGLTREDAIKISNFRACVGYSYKLLKNLEQYISK